MSNLLVAVPIVIFALPGLLLASYGGWLSIIDLRTHRLPNHHVALLTALEVVSIAMICAVTGEWSPFWSGLCTALSSLAVFVVLYLISRRQLGMGDVKYAFPAGLVVGFYAPAALVIWIFSSFLLAGLVSVIGILLGKLHRTSRIAFGPYMTLASLGVVLIHIVNSP